MKLGYGRFLKVGKWGVSHPGNHGKLRDFPLEHWVHSPESLRIPYVFCWVGRDGFQVFKFPSFLFNGYVLCSRSGIKNTSLVQSSERSSIERAIRILSQWAIQKTTFVRESQPFKLGDWGQTFSFGPFHGGCLSISLGFLGLMTFQCFNVSMGRSKNRDTVERWKSHQAETLWPPNLNTLKYSELSDLAKCEIKKLWHHWPSEWKLNDVCFSTISWKNFHVLLMIDGRKFCTACNASKTVYNQVKL